MGLFEFAVAEKLAPIPKDRKGAIGQNCCCLVLPVACTDLGTFTRKLAQEFKGNGWASIFGRMPNLAPGGFAPNPLGPVIKDIADLGDSQALREAHDRMRADIQPGNHRDLFFSERLETLARSARTIAIFDRYLLLPAALPTTRWFLQRCNAAGGPAKEFFLVTPHRGNSFDGAELVHPVDPDKYMHDRFILFGRSFAVSLGYGRTTFSTEMAQALCTFKFYSWANPEDRKTINQLDAFVKRHRKSSGGRSPR